MKRVMPFTLLFVIFFSVSTAIEKDAGNGYTISISNQAARRESNHALISEGHKIHNDWPCKNYNEFTYLDITLPAHFKIEKSPVLDYRFYHDL